VNVKIFTRYKHPLIKTESRGKFESNVRKTLGWNKSYLIPNEKYKFLKDKVNYRRIGIQY
jgi:hypothetical protein